MQLNNNRQIIPKAFSLIEVIIVLAIIASLAGAAIPNYRSYLIKAKVIEALNLLNQFNMDIYEYYFANGMLPVSGEKIFNGKSTFTFTDNKKFAEVKYINNLNSNATIGLAIKLKDSSFLSGNNYVYSWAKLNGDFIEWDCGVNSASDSIPKRYYLKSCNL